MSTRCCLENNIAVCLKHKSEVCGVCCSDYHLFNTLISTNRNDKNSINKAIIHYFKRPKNIARSGANRISSPEMPILLNAMLKHNEANLIDTITLCGFICYTARFDRKCQDRLANILKVALEAYSNKLDVVKDLKRFGCN